MDDVFKFIDDHKLIANIRASEHEDAVQLAQAILSGGFKIIEVSMSVPQAPRLIESLTKSGTSEGVLVGAGSVTDGEVAQRAISAGAKFIASHFLDTAIVMVCKNSSVFTVQSAATPTEVMEAFHAGVDLIDLYPIESLGGPVFARRLKKALPVTRLMVSGGISCENLLEYFRAGVTAVEIGSALCDKALIRAHNWTEVTERAKQFQQKLESLKIAR